MVDFFNWAKTNTEARKSPADNPGPLAIAFASELPKPVGAPHGGRAVVVGAASVFIDENWTTEAIAEPPSFCRGRGPVVDRAARSSTSLTSRS